jgi:TolB-like protein/Tfp pilus assembly protein PilF
LTITVKTATTVCGRCGAQVSVDATREVCPACLLETGLGLLAEESVAGVGSSAVASAKADDPGRDDGLFVLDGKKAARSAKILSDFGDYELLEEIGRGGQGVVYRAHQKSLNRTVALKVIGLGPWATETHLKRFRREAEAAASLEHPGIVPIHEVGERDGQCYFSMKFVEGGQLDEVVRRTPMSIRQAAELFAKVARTVHYAHEHGILHRDIKPGNILLDQKGEPHLTDFGLARLVEADSTVTGTLEVLGTPSYMAPEQAAGNNTEISRNTDVYGLGAVLYQLLTGHPPFAGGTTYETVKLLLETEPRSPRLLNPKIDRDLSIICLKCLEKDPHRRYSSALALAEDIEHWLKHEPIRAKPSGFFTHARKWIRRNPSTTVLVTLLVALAVGLSVTVWNRKPPVLIPKSIAVLPFENLSDDPNNAYFADGIQEEILTRLATISDLKVISRTSTQRYHSKPGNLAEVAKQLGVANVLEGSVQKTADQARVNVQLINAQTDSHLWAETYDRKLTDILGVESEIAKRIADSLQAKLSGREEQALAVKPTNNPEAYDAYLRGVAFEVRYYSSGFSSELEEKAISFFERAVQLDPNFAIAWARLSRANADRYYFQVDPNPAVRRDAAKRALENAQKLQPNSSETLLALGYYQFWVLPGAGAMVRGDYEAAKRTFGSVGKMLPGSSEVPNALALIARREGHWDQSIAYFEQALALDPRNVEVLNGAGMTYAWFRRLPAALKLFDRVLDITPNDPDAMAAKADIYQTEGNLQEAARLLSGINETSPSSVFETKIVQLRLERNYGEAIRLLKARLAQFHFASEIDKGRDQVALALTQRLAGDTAAAKVIAEQARNTLEPTLRDLPADVFVWEMLSNTYALMGEKDLALKGAERAIRILPSGKSAVRGPALEENLALIQTMFGEHSRPTSTLTQLLQTPYAGAITAALLRLDPIWDPLRSDPAFQKLCEEKIDKSIAVLPFENLSSDTDNTYFADGIQEEILTRLAKIADLKVISRTSTQRYQSKPRDLGEIAKQLGVANIVEGSVQKAADQVRVNVQLINAQADSHLWADTYDRKLTDIFGVESEIAKGIAAALQAKIVGREEQGLAAKPTNNPEAYDAYLQGLAFEARSSPNYYVDDADKKAIGSYEKAVQLDPAFSLAWSRLCRARALAYWHHASEPDIAATSRDGAKRALENAQKLQPDSPETLLALAYYQYRVLRDYELAKTNFRRVNKMLPSNSEVLSGLAFIDRRDGHWDESIAYLEQALVLDPRNAELLEDAAGTYKMFRQFPAALKLYDRALDVLPNDAFLLALKAGIYQAEGNLKAAAKLLPHVDPQTPWYTFNPKILQLMLERNLSEAVRLTQARLAELHFSGKFLGNTSSEAEKGAVQLSLAGLQRIVGDRAGAKLSAEQARNTLEPLSTKTPDNQEVAVWLSQAYALLGDRDLALKEAERAITLLPNAKDTFRGPPLEENLAFVQMTFGEKSRAISILSRLLQTPYPYGAWMFYSTPVTPALLRLDPRWDTLREDPAFQKICEEKQP